MEICSCTYVCPVSLNVSTSCVDAPLADSQGLYEFTSTLKISPCLVFVVSKGLKAVGISRGIDVCATIPVNQLREEKDSFALLAAWFFRTYELVQACQWTSPIHLT